MKKTLILALGMFIMVSFFITNGLVQAAEIRSITFPVIGSVSYYDDFGAPRSGHSHEGNDLMGRKMMPLVAAVDGTVRWARYPEPSWGYGIALTDSEGYQYWYLHVNNDNPGTDDGQGGGLNAYAVDIIGGAKVVRGQLIGWMGDSGNAEGTTPHLHFEIHDPSGQPFSPYQSLKAASRVTTPTPAPKQDYEVLPYGDFKGGASIAVGRFGNNATMATGAGPGGSSHVKVMSQDGQVSAEFMAYPAGFKGGLDIAAGDVDGDGIDEIITGAGPGGGPHVKIFYANGQKRNDFMAYPLAFRGGVRVAAADIDGDGKAEIITGAGPGGSPHVRIFKADGKAIGGFMAYATTFRGGIDIDVVAHGNFLPARIITSPGPGGGPHVRVFDVNGDHKNSFFAYDQAFRGGVKISVTNIIPSTNDFEIVTVPASKGGPDIRIFSSSGFHTNSAKAFEPWWRGGYEVDTSVNGGIYITANGRRASIRTTRANTFNWNNNNNNGGNWWWGN